MPPCLLAAGGTCRLLAHGGFTRCYGSVAHADVPPPEDAGRKKGKGTLYGGIDLPLYIDDILK